MKHLIFALFIMSMFFSCNKEKSVTQFSILNNTLANNEKVNPQIEESHNNEDSEEAERLYLEKDSLLKETERNKIVAYVTANLNTNFLEDEKNILDEDGYSKITIEYKYGNIIHKKHKHLYILLGTQSETHFYIYLLKNNKFEKVLTFNFATISLMGDTLRDVNGDGYNDFDIHWYAMAGCCLRNSHEIFLSKPDGTFSPMLYSFINPTFNTKTRIIRGVNYGHVQNTSLYKYKWNGFNEVDTIEYIYPNKADTINFTYLKTKQGYLGEEELLNNKSVVKLDKLPNEYLDPQNLDPGALGWFGWFE